MRQHAFNGRRGIPWRPIVILVLVLSAAESTDAQTRGERVLKANDSFIRTAAGMFHVSPRLLASIVYTEQTENVRPGKEVLDIVFSNSGYNSSMGIAQVKLETARWMEQVVNDPSSRFYLGDEAKAAINRTDSRAALIARLTNPELNLQYAAAYIAIIQKVWRNTLDKLWPRDAKVGIVATLYSLGLTRSDGTVREPHEDPTPNLFGKKAQEFYGGVQFASEFPP